MAENHRQEELLTVAQEALITFLSGEELSDEAVGKARIACAAMSSVAKLRQTDSARAALSFAMARELATNQDELARYVAITNPDNPLVKALPVPAK